MTLILSLDAYDAYESCFKSPAKYKKIQPYKNTIISIVFTDSVNSDFMGE